MTSRDRTRGEILLPSERTEWFLIPPTFPSKQRRFTRGSLSKQNMIQPVPPAGRTIFFHFFLPLFKLLSFAIDIYFAIYRHTYRIYLHKLCNTDEAYAPPRRTTYTSSCPVLSYPPISHSFTHPRRTHSRVRACCVYAK